MKHAHVEESKVIEQQHHQPIMSKDACREEKRQKKLLQRQNREQFAKEQKEAALRRAADLVRSNRIPIEITRGAAVSKSRESNCIAMKSLDCILRFLRLCFG